MSDVTFTQREFLLGKRAAFKDGFKTALKNPGMRHTLDASVRAMYPLPKVTRPRVLADPEPGYNQEWRVINGVLQWRLPTGAWKIYGPSDHGIYSGDVRVPTVKRIKLWADLLASPTEEVEDDE